VIEASTCPNLNPSDHGTTEGFAFSRLSMKDTAFCKPELPAFSRNVMKGFVARPRVGTAEGITGVEVRTCTGFDHRFDVFWEALKIEIHICCWAVRRPRRPRVAL